METPMRTHPLYIIIVISGRKIQRRMLMKSRTISTMRRAAVLFAVLCVAFAMAAPVYAANNGPNTIDMFRLKDSDGNLYGCGYSGEQGQYYSIFALEASLADNSFDYETMCTNLNSLIASADIRKLLRNC